MINIGDGEIKGIDFSDPNVAWPNEAKGPLEFLLSMPNVKEYTHYQDLGASRTTNGYRYDIRVWKL